MQNTDTLNN
jgi:ATP-dependent RNA helicase DDX19/DBP5